MSFGLFKTLFYAIHIKILYFGILIYKCITNLRKNRRLFILGPS